MDGQSHLHILIEHATGYSMFRVTEFEDIGIFQPQMIKAIMHYTQFASLVKLVAYQPFKNAQSMLENAQAIADGVLTPDLELFLEENLPSKTKKRKKWLLGVSEARIGSAITEKFQVQCSFSDIVPEIIRGIKYHYEKLISECVSEDNLKSAESSLGRMCSRSKVKFNINRADQMIIQSICLLDKLDKDINTFAMRLREWYSFHFPELFKIVNDNYKFALLAQLIKDRNKIEDPDTLSDEIEAIVEDAEIKDNVIHAMKTSMGMEISDVDMINVQVFTTRVISLIQYRNNLLDYLASRMHNVAPNLSELIGEQVGARLINRAGSLTNLAKYPASTIQILGAEKALFRALKSRGKTPKYGLIYQSSFIGRAAKKNRGRMSRLLANKCAIASRVDCLSDEPTGDYGIKLRDQVEQRLQSLTS